MWGSYVVAMNLLLCCRDNRVEMIKKYEYNKIDIPLDLNHHHLVQTLICTPPVSALYPA